VAWPWRSSWPAAFPIYSGYRSPLWPVWLVIWRVKFSIMENVAGLVGLCLIGFAVALFLLGPDWAELGRQPSKVSPRALSTSRRIGSMRLRCSPQR